MAIIVVVFIECGREVRSWGRAREILSGSREWGRGGHTVRKHRWYVLRAGLKHKPELYSTTTWRVYRSFQVSPNSFPCAPANSCMIIPAQGSAFLMSPLILHLGHPNDLQGWRRVGIAGVYLSH